MKISWLGLASFKISTNLGKVIYLDPYQIANEAEKADIIIVSHSHSDHMDSKAIKSIWKDSTILFGPLSDSNKLKRLNGKGISINKTMEIDDIKNITYKTEPMIEAKNKGDLLKFENIDKVILAKLKKLGKKVQTLKDYKGKPFDPQDSFGSDNLIEYQYDLITK